MEIVKKGKQEFQFSVLRSFFYGVRTVEVGEKIVINIPDQVGLVQMGKVKPDLPATAIYICLRDIILPGATTKYEAKRNDRVVIRAQDALPLLMAAFVVPESDEIWRPFNRRFKHDSTRAGRRGE